MDRKKQAVKTERLFLRPWSEADAEILYSLASDPDVCRNAGFPLHRSAEESLAVIRGFYSVPFQYAVCEGETGELQGGASISRGKMGSFPLAKGEGEIGIWLGRPYWGRGLGTEILRALLSLCFEELECKRVYACAYRDNTASIRMQLKCGLVPYGYVKNAVNPFDGKPVEKLVFCLNKD